MGGDHLSEGSTVRILVGSFLKRPKINVTDRGWPIFILWAKFLFGKDLDTQKVPFHENLRRGSLTSRIGNGIHTTFTET